MNAHRLHREISIGNRLFSFGRLLAPISVLALAAGLAEAQNLAYTSPSDGSDGALSILASFASGVEGTAIAYDPVRKELVAFGGTQGNVDNTPGSSVVGLNTTWIDDGTGWKAVAPTTSPSPRFGHAMVWDPNSNGGAGAILLYGGRTNGSEITPETWIWKGDDVNPTWQKLNVGTQPLGLRLFGMVYDAARDEVVLFGGASGSSVKQDTWTWSGTAWTPKTPANKPPILWGHQMAYDATRNLVVLFGGKTGGGALQDKTYTWNGSNWTTVVSTTKPGVRTGHFMEYDSGSGRVILYGGTSNGQTGKYSDTWSWDGVDWAQLDLPVEPPPRYFGDATYDSDAGKIVIFGGEIEEKNSSNQYLTVADVWTFAGAKWDPVSASRYVIDISDKPDGIWNYTTIDIAAGVVVTFNRNAANTPVIWLANGAVTIDGTVRLNGQDAVKNTRTPGEGGPGGYRGGWGALRQDTDPFSYSGEAGLGPAGGRQGENRGDWATAGQYGNAYGTPYVDPLIGGSGGGGGSGTETGHGGGGGGGGGAILIASSRDITVNGSITAKGGDKSQLNGDGGYGSGGAIVLVADRVLGTGTLNARAFVETNILRRGVIRVEGYERPLAANASPQAIGTVPYAGRSFENIPTLSVTSIAGQPIPALPLGLAEAPDLTFFDAAPVDIVVTGQNIPDGTEIKLRLTGGPTIVKLPLDGESPVTLSGGSATFNTIIPQGLGAVQATAEFSQ
ncbi:MAG: hypothetical protein DRP71_14845 [Verrucomicrobia bacterium]|nr:MAG: hypothetical protein DRP71_14845 [Verrucomicrobiota bacterium]